ncbi:MAG: tRNA (adenosine(37)-N6)-dimethylallyltransferase MiaA [Candidatus Latescibacterota bacterium]
MDRPLVVITGPTATGKTRLACELALRLPRAQIVSVDSRQVYRYADIGTAKPSAQDRARVPHHLLDIVDPDRQYSAGEYGQQARGVLRALWQQGLVPLLVGGSGLYLQAVLDGLFAEDPGYRSAAAARRLHLRHRLAAEGVGPLYAELGRLDPAAQARIGPADAPRILRGLEVAGHRPTGPGREDAPLECLPLAFCLYRERARLYDRIDARVDEMLAAGLVGETEALVARGYGRGCPAMGPMGYEEMLDYLDGRCSLAQASQRVKERSRHYGKRQLTWFRRDRRLRWLDLDVWGQSGCLQRIVLQVGRTWPHLRVPC